MAELTKEGKIWIKSQENRVESCKLAIEMYQECVKLCGVKERLSRMEAGSMNKAIGLEKEQITAIMEDIANYREICGKA